MASLKKPAAQAGRIAISARAKPHRIAHAQQCYAYLIQNETYKKHNNMVVFYRNKRFIPVKNNYDLLIFEIRSVSGCRCGGQGLGFAVLRVGFGRIFGVTAVELLNGGQAQFDAQAGPVVLQVDGAGVQVHDGCNQ